MKTIGKCTLLAPCLILSGCSALGVGDQFTYSEQIDEFEGVRVMKAQTEVVGDIDADEKVQITLICRLNNDQLADGTVRDTTFNLLFFKGKDEPSSYSNLQIKFDNEAPANADWLKTKNGSKNMNEFTIDYLSAALLTYPESERGRKGIEIGFGALGLGFASALGKGEENKAQKSFDELVAKIKLRVMAAKSLMVRYQSPSGEVNTAKLAIDSSNYWKVLNNCGWGKTPDRSADEGPGFEKSNKSVERLTGANASGSSSVGQSQRNSVPHAESSEAFGSPTYTRPRSADERTRNAAAAALREVDSSEATGDH